jgi:4-amino-4-deoxy-L-arabinose transferase-like glycosyltransferase
MSVIKNDKKTFFGKSPAVLWTTLLLIFLLGLGIRLYDLTDPPLDFHSTRQLWSAIIARGMYYQGVDDVPAWQRDLAVDAWKDKPAIEPTIFESIVALTYRIVDQEIIWIPRIYSSIFWLIGGLGLYFLARDMTSVDGGVMALIIYLFIPFGAIASRSFQPDPLMVMWIILTWWSFYRWYQNRSWKQAITAGIAAGIAMAVKSVAVFWLFGGMSALIFTGQAIKKTIRDPQVWAIATLSALPVVSYTLNGLRVLGMSSQFKGRFFPELLQDPGHYVRWGSEITSIAGFSGLILGLLGIFLFQKPDQKVFLFGLWGGYFIYGLFFPYHFLTHNYYHLPIIPMVALSLAPVADGIFQRAVALNPGWFSRTGIIGVILLGIATQMWDIRVELARSDYRHEPAYWQAIGDRIGREKDVVALTQDYGDRILYYGWLEIRNWPESKQVAYAELRSGKEFDFEAWFAEEIQGMDYFLVTRIKELDHQPELKNRLFNHYAVVDQGDGFILFDLNQPIP